MYIKVFPVSSIRLTHFEVFPFIPFPLSTMSMSVTTGDPNDAVWASFKEALRTLFLVEDRSLKQVRSEMATRHQFFQTSVLVLPCLFGKVLS